MNRKIFQLFFVLIIITAFGIIIKNYVDSIVSDYNDYKLVLSQAPQSEISRLAPIRIKLSKDIDTQKYPLNVPLENNLIKANPEIEGYIYFTNKKTLEFQPNTPLLAGHEYSIKLDIEKLFPLSKLKPFHYKLSTPNLSFNIRFNHITYFDSTGIQTPYLKGVISFNDFVEYEKKLKILNATQSGSDLNISYSPGKDDNVVEFTINGLQRTNNNGRINLFWNGFAINSKKKDSSFINIASKNIFEVVYCKTIFHPQPHIKVNFTNNIKNTIRTDSLVFLNENAISNYSINKNELIIPIKNINSRLNTLTLSKEIYGQNESGLKSEYKFEFNLYKHNTYVNIKNKNHYRDVNEFNNFLEIIALNLKEVDLNIYHVPDKNMMQFMQVNNINGASEIQRVGKLVYAKKYNLNKLTHYNPFELNSYFLNIIGADLTEPGLYNFSFSYNRNNIELNTFDSISHQITHHNIIFSNIAANAKLTTTDSLYIIASSINNNAPVKNARIEIFDYQQNKVGTLITNSEGAAKTKVDEKNLLIRIIYNNEISYLKINSDQQTMAINNYGTRTNKGYLCHIEGLKKKYKPNDSIKLAVIVKKNGKVSQTNSHYEVWLNSPKGIAYKSHVSKNTTLALIKYFNIIPYNATRGTWNVIVKNDDTEFAFPFNVEINNEFELPLHFNYSKRRNTLYLSAKKNQKYLEYLPVKVSISSHSNKIRFNHGEYTFANEYLKYDTLKFTRKIKLDKKGKAQIKLPAWLKKINILNVEANYNVSNQTSFKCDTLIKTNSVDNLLGVSTSFNWQHALLVNLININPLNNTFLPTNNINVQVIKSGKIYYDTLLNIENSHTIIIPSSSIPNGNFNLVVNNNNTTLKKTLKFLTEKKKKPSSALISLNKNQFNVGDSLLVSLKDNTAPYLITVENSEQVFYHSWIKNDKNKTLKFKVTAAMLPGAYVAIASDKHKKHITNMMYFKVVPANISTLQYITIDAPFDWLPFESEKYTITNNSNEKIQFLIALSRNTDTSLNRLPNFFNQQQYNATTSYNSLKTNTKTLAETDYSHDSIAPFVSKNIFDLKGPFTLDARESLQNKLLVSGLNGDISINVFGYGMKSGVFWENSKKARVYEPISIISKHPKFVNANDLVEFTVDICNNTGQNNLAIIELSNIKNIDIASAMHQEFELEANSKKSIKIITKIKRNKGHAAIQINTNLGDDKVVKTISFPIKSNPNYLVNSSSAIILPNKQWQKKITPFGIKGTNKAAFELANTDIPNISKLVDNLNENKTGNITSLLNRVFPLVYYNELIADSKKLNENNELINNALLKLLQQQNSNGSFKSEKQENKIWLNSYAGHFMQVAKQFNYKVNEGMLNKWIRYQKTELQRLKATQEKNSEHYHYLIYTLSLTNAFDLKELNSLITNFNESLVNNLYIANSYAFFEKVKTAKTYIDIDDIISNKENYSLYEYSLLLNHSILINKHLHVYYFISNINRVIENKKNNPTHASLALSSILNAIKESSTSEKYSINYQINNGKENLIHAESAISFIDIPLQFTLSKSIDFYNPNKDTIYINLWQTGHPQTVYKPLKSLPNIRIKNNYYAFNGSKLNTFNLKKGSYFVQKLSYFNNSNELQNLSVNIPVAAGLKVMYYKVNGEQISNFNQKAYFDFHLDFNSKTLQTIEIFYECAYKGQFISYPIKTFNNNMLYQKAFTEQPKIIIY